MPIVCKKCEITYWPNGKPLVRHCAECSRKILSRDHGGIGYGNRYESQSMARPEPLRSRVMVSGIQARGSLVPVMPASSQTFAADRDTAIKAAGRRAWKTLHLKHGITQQWLMGIWLPTVPCGKCKQEAIRYIPKHQPPYGDDEGMFVWSWEFHNYVNTLLNKPIVNLQSAKTLWHKS